MLPPVTNSLLSEGIEPLSAQWHSLPMGRDWPRGVMMAPSNYGAQPRNRKCWPAVSSERASERQSHRERETMSIHERESKSRREFLMKSALTGAATAL